MGTNPRQSHVFLDDGGVLNDNRRRAFEWRRLIGEFMPPRLGSTSEAWQRANLEVFPIVWRNILAMLPRLQSHGDLERAYAIDWMTQMCDALGLGVSADEDAIRLHGELSIYVAERADAAIPGAAEAVRKLHAADLTLYTASGATSRELNGILGRMGIRDCFVRLYGPDLVDYVKYGPAYYERIIRHAGLEPDSCLVIDSDEECRDWAQQAGAHAAWIDPKGRGDARTLLELVERITGPRL